MFLKKAGVLATTGRTQPTLTAAPPLPASGPAAKTTLTSRPQAAKGVVIKDSSVPKRKTVAPLGKGKDVAWEADDGSSSTEEEPLPGAGEADRSNELIDPEARSKRAHDGLHLGVSPPPVREDGYCGLSKKSEWAYHRGVPVPRFPNPAGVSQVGLWKKAIKAIGEADGLSAPPTVITPAKTALRISEGGADAVVRYSTPGPAALDCNWDAIYQVGEIASLLSHTLYALCIRLIDFYSYCYYQLVVSAQSLEFQYKHTSAQLDIATKHVRRHRADVEKLQSFLKKAKDDSARELKSLADQHRAELAARCSEYEGQISSLQNIHKAEIEKFEEELTLAQSARPSIDAEMLEKQLAEKTQQMADATEELNSLRAFRADMEARFAEKEAELQEALQNLKTAIETGEAADIENAELAKEIRQLKEENEALKKKAAGILLVFPVYVLILLGSAAWC